MRVEEREFSGDKRFGGSGFTETELEIGRAVERLGRDWSLQPYQVSLAWLLSRPAVASVIVGVETVDEITANATAADVKLEQAQLDALTALQAEESDIDLLFTMDSPLSLMQLNALSDRIGALLEASVDLVPDTALSPLLRDRVLAEAVPL